jgi:hypothetical protein
MVKKDQVPEDPEGGIAFSDLFIILLDFQLSRSSYLQRRKIEFNDLVRF